MRICFTLYVLEKLYVNISNHMWKEIIICEHVKSYMNGNNYM